MYYTSVETFAMLIKQRQDYGSTLSDMFQLITGKIAHHVFLFCRHVHSCTSELNQPALKKLIIGGIRK